MEAVLQDFSTLPENLEECQYPEHELYQILEKRLPEYFNMPEGWINEKIPQKS